MDRDPQFSVSIPLDSDGFVRRLCPTCDREFKWFNGQTDGTPEDWEEPESYYCPYCGVTADRGAWSTEAQSEYVMQMALGHAGDFLQDEMEDIVRGVNRQGGLIRMSVSSETTGRPPPPLSEPNDMTAVAPPCHPFEPIKVLDERKEALYCLVCGLPFAVD